MPKQPKVGLMFPKDQTRKKKQEYLPLKIKHPDSIILGTIKERCFMCGAWGITHKHHLFGGNPNRNHSEHCGLFIYLCPDCHQSAEESPHNDAATADMFHQMGQRAFEERIGSREQFMKVFGRNYL